MAKSIDTLVEDIYGLFTNDEEIKVDKKHLDALQKVAPALLSTYRELGLQTIPIALDKGKIDQHKAEELQAILKQPD